MYPLTEFESYIISETSIFNLLWFTSTLGKIFFFLGPATPMVVYLKTYIYRKNQLNIKMWPWHARTILTDRRTDRQTDRRIFYNIRWQSLPGIKYVSFPRFICLLRAKFNIVLGNVIFFASMTFLQCTIVLICSLNIGGKLLLHFRAWIYSADWHKNILQMCLLVLRSRGLEPKCRIQATFDAKFRRTAPWELYLYCSIDTA